MTAVKWHEGHLVGLDTETNGTNPLTARIVTAAIVHAKPGERPTTMQWLIHPEQDIPAEAAAVHGWTLDRLEARLAGRPALRIIGGREQQLPRDAALFEIAAQAATAMGTGAPLVVHNAAYDLTLLETELARNGIDTLASRPTGIVGVVDPMVVERQFDPYRKVKGGCRGGKHQCGGCGVEDKTLGSLCLHYGIRHTGAHDAAGDALAAIRLARRLAGLWPQIATWKLSTLHANQVQWRKQQADSLREYFDSHGIEHDGVDPGWPVYRALVPSEVPVGVPLAPRPGGREHLSECLLRQDREAWCTCDDVSPEWTVAS
jgi:DNA polymerase-3 subunit epsilon